MLKDQQQRDFAKQQKELLEKYIKSPEILTLITKYKRPLHHIFKYFSRQDDIELNETVLDQTNTLNIAKFSKLCSIFLIVPELILAEDVIFLYRHTTKNKSEALKIDFYQSKNKSFAEKDTQLLDFNDFICMLIKLGLMVKDKLDNEGKRDAKINKQLDTNGADAGTFLNLLKYMDIQENEPSRNIDKKLNVKTIEAKSVKRLFGKKLKTANTGVLNSKNGFPAMISRKEIPLFES